MAAEKLMAVYDRRMRYGGHTFNVGEVFENSVDCERSVEIVDYWIGRGWIQANFRDKLGIDRDKGGFILVKSDSFRLTDSGIRQAQILIEQRYPESLSKRFVLYLKDNWLALGALLVSVFALFKG